eukprot:CAMPEP_0179259136 /NCGR_PEP_ID=MMETSP0797-20121207/25669_1 /TAXON_ID=47934 /ORGANISM="Dinophysis acuminata, Strain DAEP01" /LENGTH=616 /DNA_ID=CAMNT_0020967177 /DNA_START=61 /DNA_END=1911 /DNA_ORIENTATION=-
MGSGASASAGISAAISSMGDADLKQLLSSLPAEQRCKVQAALSAAKPKKKLMVPQVVESTTFDREQVPDGFDEPPIVAVLLPGPQYSKMICSQDKRSFTYHLLRNFEYNMFDPIPFDADAFVEEAIAYCREHKVAAVTAFDCFPTFLASIVRQELGLPGPSFQSVLHCCNKYYMRRNLTPDCQPYPAGVPPPTYPAVVKLSDTQFYSAVRIVQDEAEWRAAWESLSSMLAVGREARQRFYFKWSTRFGFALESKWEDIVLIHTEPYLKNTSECQVEVVVTSSGEMLIADTGDLVHMKGGDNITMFKTPANMKTTPAFTAWLKKVVGSYIELGYKGLAMDVEFMKLDCDEEKYELNEINSRYSYMGDWAVAKFRGSPCDTARNFCSTFLTLALQASGNNTMEAFRAIDVDGDGTMSRAEVTVALEKACLKSGSAKVDAIIDVLDKDGNGVIERCEFCGAMRDAKEASMMQIKEVRNVLNRTRLALGADPATLPCRDEPTVAKLAVAVFTKRLGPIGGIFDQAACNSYLADKTFDDFQPEPPVTSGAVTEAFQIYGGWARLGYLLMTWENDLPKINARLNEVIKALHIQKEGDWLPVQLDTEVPVAPGDMLRFDHLKA